MVGQRTLDPPVEVRVLPSQPDLQAKACFFCVVIQRGDVVRVLNLMKM